MQKERLHRAWREANDLVREAEDRLAATWDDFAAGLAPPPSAVMLTEISQLRRDCDQRLSAVLNAFNEARDQDGREVANPAAPEPKPQ